MAVPLVCEPAEVHCWEVLEWSGEPMRNPDLPRTTLQTSELAVQAVVAATAASQYCRMNEMTDSSRTAILD